MEAREQAGKMMKGKRRFKAPNYSRGCLLAKAFGVSAANSGERTAWPLWWAGDGFNARTLNAEMLTSYRRNTSVGHGRLLQRASNTTDSKESTTQSFSAGHILL